MTTALHPKYGTDFLEDTEIGPRVRCRPGVRYQKTMPYSEVCLHFGKAGQVMAFELKVRKIEEGPDSAYWCCSVQLYRADGQQYSGPITTGEAGVFMDYQSEDALRSRRPGDPGPEPLFYFYPESPGG
jgi:hypothetical protein